MRQRPLVYLVSFATVIALLASLAWLTEPDEVDPCAAAQADISAAALAEPGDDQQALVNRAIIMRGKCEEE